MSIEFSPLHRHSRAACIDPRRDLAAHPVHQVKNLYHSTLQGACFSKKSWLKMAANMAWRCLKRLVSFMKYLFCWCCPKARLAIPLPAFGKELMQRLLGLDKHYFSKLMVSYDEERSTYLIMQKKHSSPKKLITHVKVIEKDGQRLAFEISGEYFLENLSDNCTIILKDPERDCLDRSPSCSGFKQREGKWIREPEMGWPFCIGSHQREGKIRTYVFFHHKIQTLIFSNTQEKDLKGQSILFIEGWDLFDRIGEPERIIDCFTVGGSLLSADYSSNLFKLARTDKQEMATRAIA